jgi:hypothetical protein
MQAPNGETLGVYAQIRHKGRNDNTRNITLNYLTQSEALEVLRAANGRAERRIQRLLRKAG